MSQSENKEFDRFLVDTLKQSINSAEHDLDEGALGEPYGFKESERLILQINQALRDRKTQFAKEVMGSDITRELPRGYDEEIERDHREWLDQLSPEQRSAFDAAWKNLIRKPGHGADI